MKKIFLRAVLLTAAVLPLKGGEIIDLTGSSGSGFPLPEKYRNRQVTDITSAKFSGLKQLAAYGLKLIDDRDAVGGRALCLGAKQNHAQIFSMGIQGRTSKKALAGRKLTKAQIPKDEKYHLYSLGQVTLEPAVIFWGHKSWALQQDLSRCYNGTDAAKNNVEVVVSLKFTGPAYVPGSAAEDSVRLDRILLVGQAN